MTEFTVKDVTTSKSICPECKMAFPLDDGVRCPEGGPLHCSFVCVNKNVEAKRQLRQFLDQQKKEKPDVFFHPVNKPRHYVSHKSGVECIKVTEHMNFCLGNAMKYIWRADLKGGSEDLKKAIWYLGREIDRRAIGGE